jgi:AcrR family transcriptional regulator
VKHLGQGSSEQAAVARHGAEPEGVERRRSSEQALGLRERKKEQTRQALESAALTLFAEKGFDGTTVDEIAEACDVSQRTFFRYYSTKEDVLFADGDERLEALLAEIVGRPADEQPLRAVQAGFLSTVAEYAQDRERLILRSKVFDGSSGLKSHKFERQQNWEAEVTAALVEREARAGRTTSELRLRLVAGASMACLHAALHQWIEEGGDLWTLVNDGFDYLSEGLTVHDVERVPSAS